MSVKGRREYIHAGGSYAEHPRLPACKLIPSNLWSGLSLLLSLRWQG